MKAAALLLLAAATATTTGSGRVTLGAYGGWAAFRDASPPRCFAIARPVVLKGDGAGSASVATWPRRGLRASFHVRLSRVRSRAAPVTLSIGERRFVLAAGDRDGWATDAPSDGAIVDAMRSGRSMSVEAVGAGGAPFADVYALAGAATAIDDAALACAGR